MKSFVGLVALWSVLALYSVAVAQTSHAFLWTASDGMQDLGVVPGWLDSLGYGIDRSGAVVGCDGRETGGSAFGWTIAVSAGPQRTVLFMFYLTYLCGIGVGPGPVLIHT